MNSLIASGDIRPCRFVTRCDDFQFRQAGDGDPIFGVSQSHFRFPGDRRHAVNGGACFLHLCDLYFPGNRGQAIGDVLVEVGEQAIAKGSRLKSDADGNAVPALPSEDSGAIALADGYPGEIIKISLLATTIMDKQLLILFPYHLLT